MFKQVLLNKQFCKEKGHFIQHIEPIDINEDNFLDYAVPFNFGFLNQENNASFNVPNIRTVGNQFVIHSYKDLNYKTDDIIRFDNKFYTIDNVYASYENDGFNTIKHYFITLK